MNVVHLTASTFYGGPERQMLGLARALPRNYQSVFFSFREGGRCQAFLDEAKRQSFEAQALAHDTPRLWAAVGELADRLQQQKADILCCHGYKANLLGLIAARRTQVPVAAISRGWTGETLKVRLFEALDRFSYRQMDRVVCVSQGQAVKVRKFGIPDERLTVIHNAIEADRFVVLDPADRQRLEAFFPQPPRRIVCAAGRLSPEKGFDVLIQAAKHIVAGDPDTGFILFGEGFLRDDLLEQIEREGLTHSFLLPGFRADLDRLLACVDLLVLPSHTEGLPNVVLEAFAAGVPVVATAVGGTPEVVQDGVNGYLVPPGEPAMLARRIQDVFASEEKRLAMGRQGKARVTNHFSFAAQSAQYQRLFAEMVQSAPVTANRWRDYLAYKWNWNQRTVPVEPASTSWQI